MEDEANTWKVLGNSQARCEVMFVGVHQPSRITQLAADENGRNAVVKNQVRVGVVFVIERAGVLITEAEVESRRGRHLPTIFSECRRSPGAQIHLRYASLSLFHGGPGKPHASPGPTPCGHCTKIRGVATAG